MTVAIGVPPQNVAEIAGVAGVAEAATSDVGTAAPLDVGTAIVLVAALGLFAYIARRVTTKSSQPFDQNVRDVVQAHRSPVVDVAVKPVTLLSMPLLVVSATTALVWWLRHEGRSEGAFAVGLTPLVAAAVGQSFTTFLEQRNPPDASDSPNGEVREPSFPSGHTTGVTAEALGIAYILTREDLATPLMLTSLVAWPLVVGVVRVYRDRHWISDVFGGWVAGVGVAALAALIYEWRRKAALEPAP